MCNVNKVSNIEINSQLASQPCGLIVQIPGSKLLQKPIRNVTYYVAVATQLHNHEGAAPDLAMQLTVTFRSYQRLCIYIISNTAPRFVLYSYSLKFMQSPRGRSVRIASYLYLQSLSRKSKSPLFSRAILEISSLNLSEFKSLAIHTTTQLRSYLVSFVCYSYTV